MLEQGGWKDGALKASEQFHNRLEDTLQMIDERAVETEKRNSEKKRRMQRFKKFAVRCVGAAAAAGIFLGVCYQNPVWAAQLPLIGHIFEKMADKLSYGEDYEKYVEPVKNPQEAERKTGDSEGTAEEYSQTVNGTTVTLSEIYYSGNALYLGLMIESEKPFKETLRGWQDDTPNVRIETEEMYSFASDSHFYYADLEGDFIDSHTYAGVARLDMAERDGSLLQGVENTDGPAEDFTLDFTISQIIGDLAEPERLDTGYTLEELEAMPENEWNAVMKEARSKGDWDSYPNKYENWWIDGEWRFHLDIAVDENQKQVVEVNMVDETGAGIQSVEKTPFEISVNEVFGTGEYRYWPVMLDAQGKFMESKGRAGQYVGTSPVKGYDVSTVYVYLCDFDEYVEIKGKRLTDPEGFKALMDEMAVMKTEVHFE